MARERRDASWVPLVSGTALLAVVTLGAAGVGAEPGRGVAIGRGRADRGTEVYTYVPPPPDLYERREPYFYGRERIEIPGALTVNTPPYACSLDGRTFGDRSGFAMHLKTEHRSALEASLDPFVVGEDGQVRFVP
jgi:hypothetical protein